ncbi:hypothetical protein [Trinickia dinghuensis]|uniref:Uncharacterized protein n=1 Tax=Trinickia dinghuensis TaxID=2291023 RepID=A0A3D8K4G2_9BURK|nr:hypothetical protein [Trinickia dinghuensis]RDU99755.1 hypothetical protein DWV00_04880 [Trinickia dinghuensis]
MDSTTPRLRPEIADIAALRQLVRSINDRPGRVRVPDEHVEHVVRELAKYHGLALDGESKQ